MYALLQTPINPDYYHAGYGVRLSQLREEPGQNDRPSTASELMDRLPII